MVVMALSLEPAIGDAFTTWTELDERVGWLLPRVRAAFGVQEVFAHDRFFLRAMVTQLPSPALYLTVFVPDGADPAADDRHPVWAILGRLARRNDWQIRRVLPPKEPVPVPPGAERLPMPDDHTARLADPVVAAGIDLADLDTVGWDGLGHAYGSAGDVPGLIRAVASADPHTRRQAFRSLYGNLYHQGSTYPATVAAVPFLLRILAAAPDGAEEDLLAYLCAICEYDEEVIRATAAGETRIAVLAERGDDTGLWARRLTACLARLSPSAADRLEGYIAAAADPVDRTDWLLWLEQLDEATRWRPLLTRYLVAPEPEVRLAAAISLLRHGPVTVPVLDVLFQAVADPEPFKAWSEHGNVWQLNGHHLGEQAASRLSWLDEDTVAGAVASAGGARAAADRWPAVREVWRLEPQ